MAESSIGNTSDVTVIGAGIVGIATALYLQRDGHSVTVVDRDEPGQATSFGNAGAFAIAEVMPLSAPGVLWRVPGWLFDPLGPLAIRWRYLPQLFPWLVRFIAAGRSVHVQAQIRALAALLIDAPLQLLDALQGLIPAPLQFACHQPIVGVAGIVLFPSPVGGIARSF